MADFGIGQIRNLQLEIEIPTESNKKKVDGEDAEPWGMGNG
jgi:hypothetical protein